MKKSIARYLKIILLLVFFGQPYWSFSQTKEESIKELIGLTEQNIQTEQALESMLLSMNSIETDSLKKEKMSTSMKSMLPVMNKITESFIANEIAGLYDKFYTHKEIIELIAFYKSPVGKKSLRVAPEIMKSSMEIFTTKYLPEMSEEIRKLQKSRK